MTALDHHTHALAAGSRTADVVARVASGARNLLRWFTGRHADCNKALMDAGQPPSPIPPRECQ